MKTPELIQNVTLLVTLGVVYRLLSGRLDRSTLWGRIVFGLLFGGVAILVMMSPWQIRPGVVFDGRSVILSLAGIFGGWAPALIATVMTAVYRLSMGGDGAWTGCGVIASSALLGVIFRHLRRQRSFSLTPLKLYLFGVTVHLVMLGWMLTLPAEEGLKILRTITFPVLVVMPLATMLVGWVLLDQDTQRNAEVRRKQNEDTLRLRDRAIHAANDGICLTGSLAEGTPLRFANQGFERLTGYRAAEVLGRNMRFLQGPGTDAATLQRLRVAIRAGEDCVVELLNYRKDGQPFWNRLSITPVKDDAGAVTHFVAVLHDVTARKQAEAARRESEERFRTAIMVAPFPIMIHAENAEVIAINQAWTEITGYSRAEIPTINDWTEKAYGARKDAVRAHIATLYDLGRKIEEGEFEFQTKSGETRIWKWGSAPLGRTPGGRRLVISMALDLTEQKQALELLRRHQERLQRTQAVGHVGSWEFDPQSGKIWGSDETFRIFGLPYANEEVPIEEVEACIPERARVHQALADLIHQGTPCNLDYEVHPADGGAPRVVNSIGELLRDAHGKPLKVIGVVQDITERKRAETALQESERLMQTFTQATSDALWNWDLTTGLVERSVGFEEHFGYRRAEIEPPIEWWVEHVHPEDRARVLAIFEAAKAAGEESCSYQYRFQRRDRGYAHVFDRVYFVRDTQGQTVRCLGAMTDLSDLKQAEEEIRAAHQRLTYHVENSPLAVVERDRDLRVQRWSQQCEKLFGWRAEEVIGKFPAEWQLVHPDDQPAVEQTMGGLLQRLEPRNVSSNRNFTKEGRVIQCEWYNSALVGPDGHIASILSLVHDITERKQAEMALQQSQQQLRALSARLETLREAERTRISREIHDELGQLLTGVKIDLRWMERRVAQMSDAALQSQMGEKLRGMKGLVDDTIKSVQRIAAELRPGTLDRLGLVAALRDEAERFMARTEIQVELNLEEPTQEIATDTTTAFFRVFQEILTNVVRHAQATRVQVEFRQENAHWRLTVRDNGRGLPPAPAGERQSLGLLGMRERAMLLGGTVEVSSQAADGTTVDVRIPVDGETANAP